MHRSQSPTLGLTDRESLAAAVDSDPDDATSRLAFADWLDEHGEEDTAREHRDHGMAILAMAEIRRFAEARQASLDAAADAARALALAAIRAACLEGVEPGTPAYAVCALVANAVAIDLIPK